MGDPNASYPHLFDSAVYICRMQIDSTAGVLNQMGFQSQANGVQNRKLHAVISGEAHYVNIIDPVSLQKVTQLSGVAFAVVKKATVAVYFRINSFSNHCRPTFLF